MQGQYRGQPAIAAFFLIAAPVDELSDRRLFVRGCIIGAVVSCWYRLHMLLSYNTNVDQLRVVCYDLDYAGH